jgi:hypothetical protein
VSGWLYRYYLLVFDLFQFLYVPPAYKWVGGYIGYYPLVFYFTYMCYPLISELVVCIAYWIEVRVLILLSCYLLYVPPAFKWVGGCMAYWIEPRALVFSCSHSLHTPPACKWAVSSHWHMIVDLVLVLLFFSFFVHTILYRSSGLFFVSFHVFCVLVVCICLYWREAWAWLFCSILSFCIMSQSIKVFSQRVGVQLVS